MQRHPLYGYRMIQSSPALKEGAKLAVLEHHERLDGSGYPLKLTGEKLHPYSKIVAAADTYHALTSDRSYRRRQSPFKVLEDMQLYKFGAFETEVLQKLTDAFTAAAKGMRVTLSDGKKGELVFYHRTRPEFSLVRLADGQIVSPGQMNGVKLVDILPEE